MMTSTMLLLFFMITILLIAVLYYKNNLKQFKKTDQNENKEEEEKLTEQQVLKTFSFHYIIDSKFIGLFVFLLSNVLTGVINLNIKTLYVETNFAFLILIFYNLVSYLIPFLFYYYYYY